MLGKTNVGGIGGGGMNNHDAMLLVEAPAGSTVVMTRSGTSLSSVVWTDPGSQDVSWYVFTIRPSLFSSSEWTITATKNSQSKSTTLIINTASVFWLALQYSQYLITAGACNVPFTLTGESSMPSPTGDYMRLSRTYATCMAYTTSKVDLGSYSTLKIMLTLAGDNKAGWSLEGTNAPAIGIGTSVPTLAQVAGQTRIYLDASNITKCTKFITGNHGPITQLEYSLSLVDVDKTVPYYISVSCSGYASGNEYAAGYLNIKDFWLE